ncbi:MAG: M28 family peptidase [Dehalococcoidia bacterium]|nr:MAG: M28 family peptidase [Dehalococcoidia bacterium]
MPPIPAGLDPARIEARLRAYEAFGIHRTGWPGDDKTTEWLRAELGAAGVASEAQRFAFPRVEVQRARLTWSDGFVDGEPMYDGGFTRIGGLTGDLGEDGDPEPFGKILIATSAMKGDRKWVAPEARAHYAALENEGVLGIVVPIGDAEGEIILRNAEHIRQPFGVPVLQVASKHARYLNAALLQGGEATLEVDGDRLNSRATNVIATLPGSDESAEPIVVMTPKSGWFTCTAERGGGIAIWLSLAEGLAALPARRRTVHFVASSGHELHHQGLEEYMKQRPALAKGAHVWLHLGASIGAKRAVARMGAADEALHSATTAALASAGIEGYEAMEVGQPGGGEARNIAQHGGRYVTFLGGHPYFHSPQDTFEKAGDPASVARWGTAMWTVLTGLLD